LRRPIARPSITRCLSAAPGLAAGGGGEFARTQGIFILDCHRSANRAGFCDVTPKSHEVGKRDDSAGHIDGEVVDAAHSYGGVVFHDVINVKHARKAAEQGVDGLILVCAGAGGHAGTLSPFALVREVKQWFKGTILLSGAISDGWGIASALALGADMAYMGTRFIATEEANADPAYKKALTEYAAHDTVYTNLFTGVHGNYLGPSIAAAGLDPDNLPAADKWKMNVGSGGNMKVKAWRDIWGSGQGIGQIKDAPPVAELVERLKAEFNEARDDFLKRASA
jgi:nitronate monooxygenase